MKFYFETKNTKHGNYNYKYETVSLHRLKQKKNDFKVQFCFEHSCKEILRREYLKYAFSTKTKVYVSFVCSFFERQFTKTNEVSNSKCQMSH